jgi:GTP-binding protein
MQPQDYNKIRNVAIIAHVDHGKTTLVDGILKQTKTFRDNEAEMSQIRILDSNDLEKERGITILAKTASVHYKGYKINIIDTPGHADFGGEVEKTLNMADGCLLIIDAQEGPMPQTTFVLRKALELGKKIILVINKIDKKFADVESSLEKTSDLFLELAVNEDQIDFPILYAIGREGKAFTEMPTTDLATTPGDLTPILDAIIADIPHEEANVSGGLQMQVTLVDHDSYQGLYCIGKITRGQINLNSRLVLIRKDGTKESVKVSKIFLNEGLKRVEGTQAYAGDIIAVTGIKNAKIGDTIADAANPEKLADIKIEEPSVRVKIEANSSPFVGKEGKFVTSRQIKERLEKEMESNLSMKLDVGDDGSYYVSGRGELHLSILIETLRREGYEFQISKPTAITKVIDGVDHEPLEEVLLDAPADYIGTITTELSKRSGKLINMHTDSNNNVRFQYEVLTKNLFGLRTTLLTQTKGTVVINTFFKAYVPKERDLASTRKGALVASETGTAMAYSIEKVQERGDLFIRPQEQVYEGMIVGINKYDNDMNVNVCTERHKTGVRVARVEIDIALTPVIPITLDNAFGFLDDDELLEVTPKALRMRKKILPMDQRSVKRETRYT